LAPKATHSSIRRPPHLVSSLPALLPPIPAPCVLAEPYKDKRETSCDRNWLAPRVQVSSSLDRLDLPMGPCFDRPLNPALIDHEVNSISALFLILTIGRRRASRFFLAISTATWSATHLPCTGCAHSVACQSPSLSPALLH
ncbi:uncharacterized protein CLUP02_01278, partial [Colletotrichum lupini]